MKLRSSLSLYTHTHLQEEELLSLTRASSGEHAEVVVLKGECEGLKGECEGLRREAEELKTQHQAQVEALKGTAL